MAVTWIDPPGVWLRQEPALPGRALERRAELRRGDRDQPPRARGERLGESSRTRADFNYCRLRHIAQRVHNALRRPDIRQEVLPYFRLRPIRASPLSGRGWPI